MAQGVRVTKEGQAEDALQSEPRRPQASGTGELGAEARARVLNWYQEHQRRLPWRVTGAAKPDPYRVLVSEIMLQQTQVDVVLPRYLDFLQAFPDVASLAAAAPERVREQWSGLGYYRRAEALQGAARAIVERGGFPQCVHGLRQLPGVGEYTAAAIASIAFTEAVAVLDGNVERVLARVRMVEGNLKLRAPRRLLQAAADQLLDHDRPGTSNQALMELGALVCRKQKPSCSECPLQRDCGASAVGLEHAFPQAVARRDRRKRWWRCAIELRAPSSTLGGPELLLRRRAEDATVLGGRWLPPPFAEQDERESHQESTELGRFKHSITRTDYTVVLLQRHPQGRPATLPTGQRGSGTALRWVSLDDFDDHGRWRGQEPLPTSSMMHKAVVELRRALAAGAIEAGDLTAGE